MSADRLLSVEEARSAVFAAIAGPTEPEWAWLSEALGRVASEPVTSPLDLPPWDNSAVDGYAIRYADVAGASEGDGGAGDPPGRDRALGLPAEAGPAPALVPPDATRALWLAGLVALVLTLVAGVTVVLARELE